MTDGTTGSTEYSDSQSLLTAARTALNAGQARLAIHLYSAAFESEAGKDGQVSDELIAGMRIALNLAFDLGDKHTAETLLDTLGPFNTVEQSSYDQERLRSMEPSALEALVLDATNINLSEGVEEIVRALSEMVGDLDGADYSEWMKHLKALLGLPAEGNSGEETREGGGLRLPGGSESGIASPEGGFVPGWGGFPGAPGFGAALGMGVPGTGSVGMPGMPAGTGTGTAGVGAGAPGAGVPGGSTAGGAGRGAGLGSDDPGNSLLLIPPGSRSLANRPGSGDRLAEGSPGGPGGEGMGMGPRRGWRMDYNHIVGYDRAMEQMRKFGFYRRYERELHRFADRMAELHGVGKLSLSQPFLFTGDDFADINTFANATAFEIGWPIINIKVDLDDRSNGTIKITGPFRHRVFGGPPELGELNTPCTVLLEDIEALHRIFETDSRTWTRGEGNAGSPGFGSGGAGGAFGAGGGAGGSGSWDPGMNRRSVRFEFGNYLRELLNKPGVFFMATCKNGFELSGMLADIIGPMHEIHVDNPDDEERRAIWERLKKNHPSIQGLPTELLVEYSEGISRATLFDAIQEIVDDAYQISLASGQYRPVLMGDILTRLGSFADQDSEVYQRLEDAAAAEFLREMEEL